MQEITNSSDQLLLVFVVLFLSFLLASVMVLFYSVKRGFLMTIFQIKQSVIPKFLTVTPQTQDIIDMAIELWRLEKRLLKIEEKLSSDENKAMSNSVDKIKRFVQKNDLEITEYTGQVYNEGMNLDILSSEKDPDLEQSIISETHEPAVSHKGILIRKAKVIVREK